MKKYARTSAMFIGLSALLGTAALVAQNPCGVAEIPFGFQVKNTTLPAGTYRVAAANSGIVTFRNMANGHSIVVLSGIHDTSSRVDGHLTFMRYGSQHFLTQVQLPGEGTSLKIPRSAQEKELAKGPEPAAIASVGINVE